MQVIHSLPKFAGYEDSLRPLRRRLGNRNLLVCWKSRKKLIKFKNKYKEIKGRPKVGALLKYKVTVKLKFRHFPKVSVTI